MAMSHVAARMGDLSPIQRGLRIGRKGPDQSDRAIGHNGEQILISEIVAVRDGLGRTVDSYAWFT